MYLFFDTETTGVPDDRNAPLTDFDNWPRMVQIAWIFEDKTGNRIEQDDFIIKPENFDIPQESSEIHGITNKKAKLEGKDLNTVLVKFSELLNKADTLVGHNISFDVKIIGAELLRNNFHPNFREKKKICTQKSSTNYCKLPGKYGYKWPTLPELHTKLFGEDFKEAHDASVDIKATEKCFWELKNRGVL